jgi:hypothetical protein
MSGTGKGTGTGAIEIVSIATELLTLTVVIVRALAHLNMTRMLLSAGEHSRIGRRGTGLSPPRRRERREDDRFERPRRSPAGDHYGTERREREVERERSYVSRADPRESSVSLLDYGDGTGRTASARRRRDSDESASKRDIKVRAPLLSRDSFFSFKINTDSAARSLLSPPRPQVEDPCS